MAVPQLVGKFMKNHKGNPVVAAQHRRPAHEIGYDPV